MRFSLELVQVVPFPDLLDDVLFAESLGIRTGWVADQLVVSPAAPDLLLLEAWTTLGALASRTTRIRLGTLVTNAAMRNPAWLAKQALTVDHISGGRLDLGIGAGYYAEEHAYVGIDFLDGRGRTARLAEAVAILDRGLRGEHVTFEGEHFHLQDAPMQPAPVQTPRPPLYVAGKARTSLRAAAEHADVWVLVGEAGAEMDAALAEFRQASVRLDEACAAAGRDPRSIKRCYSAGFANEPVFASIDAAAEFVGRYQEAGADELSFYLHNPKDPVLKGLADAGRVAERDMLARVAEEVFAKHT